MINDWFVVELIVVLNLIFNVEYGFFVEMFCDEFMLGMVINWLVSIVIYYLFEGKVGWLVWYKVDVVEVWYYYVGVFLILLLLINDGVGIRNVVFGWEIFNGEKF